jgi:hypothetical protein
VRENEPVSVPLAAEEEMEWLRGSSEIIRDREQAPARWSRCHPGLG